MGRYDNILLIEIEDPTKLNEMERYLLGKYNARIKTLYKTGAIIAMKVKNSSEKELMKKIKSDLKKLKKKGIVKEVTKYKPY